ncbi:hypothetical protein D9M68_678210 [compost metagenome]
MAAQPVEDVVAAEHLAGLAGQQREQVELGAGEFHALAVAQHLAPVEVDREAVEHAQLRIGDSRCRRAALAAQDGLHARHEFARLEGLGQVVVGAEFEADHAVHHLAARGEHHDGDVAFLADLAAQLEAVHLGQHDVEDGRVVVPRAQLGDAFARALGAVERVAEACEVGGQRRGEVFVVVDQQDARHGGIVPPGKESANGKACNQSGRHRTVQTRPAVRPASKSTW